VGEDAEHVGTYTAASVVETVIVPIGAILHHPGTESLYHELDRANDRYEQRMQLWPRGELVIGFRTVRVDASRDAWRAEN
jgi:hypothetical protein